MDLRNVVIIGSGPAGLTAAIYCARANLKPIVIGGLEFGGQLMTTTEVENYPGFPDGIQGPELMDNMIKQAQRFGAEIVYENVVSSKLEGEIKEVSTQSNTYQARAVIITTGASPRLLDIPGEQTYWGKGVSSCATCDGAFYRNKVVAIIGGGDSAMEEALFLTRFASKVYVIHRRNEFRASKIMQERVLAHEKIEVIWNSQVVEVKSNNGKVVDHLHLKDLTTDKEMDLTVDGMFLAIGHLPNSGFLNGQLTVNSEGYIEVTDHTKTALTGVFVAGDVHDHHYRQAVTAAGMGCMAAIDCERWLAEQGK